MVSGIQLAEKRILPDWVIRIGIRKLLAKRLKQEACDDQEISRDNEQLLVDELKQSPLAVETDAANAQHYEVPAEFYDLVLGDRLKYSCCLFNDDSSSIENAGSLDQAEVKMLELTCQRGELRDGMDILELGCGWGSLTVWMAEQYPNSRITAVSNSSSQKAFIENNLASKGLTNVEIVTADMREFQTEHHYDRVVSVEMFEHMRNFELLMQRISGWLKEEGKLFVHIFCNRSASYLFETEGDENWMGRYFFTGGIMPSLNLLGEFQQHLTLDRQWEVNGNHYWKTSEAWLNNLDRNRSEVERIFREKFDRHEAAKMVQRWRMFFLACAELFRYRDGNEWFVSHYLFSKNED